MADHEGTKPDRQKTKLDEEHGFDHVKKTDPRVLEREHAEHQPDWTHRRKRQPQHRKDEDEASAGFALMGVAA